MNIEATETATPKTESERLTDFERELCRLINRHSMENGSDTSDSILARYLRECLMTFNHCVKARDIWYGISPRPGHAHDHD